MQALKCWAILGSSNRMVRKAYRSGSKPSVNRTSRPVFPISLILFGILITPQICLGERSQEALSILKQAGKVGATIQISMTEFGPCWTLRDFRP